MVGLYVQFFVVFFFCWGLEGGSGGLYVDTDFKLVFLNINGLL